MNTDPEMTLAEGLRAAADLLDANPVLTRHATRSRLGVVTHSAEEFIECAQALGGHRVKESDESYTSIIRQFGPVTVDVFGGHEQVCEAKVVGTETVEIPAVEASPARTETRDIIEWVCPPVLGEAS